MQVELKVNGKTVHAEISEEQAKILGGNAIRIYNL